MRRAPTPEKILDRVRKLLALADDKAATPEEAANAAARAQSLLFQHKLSLADVAAPVTDGIAEHDVVGDHPVWQRRLAIIVTEYTFCDVVRSVEHRTMRFIGAPEDLAVCLYLFEHLRGYLGRAADRCWALHRQLTPRRVPTDEEREGWYLGFYEGAVDAIKRRMRDQRTRDVADAGRSGGQLVRLTNALVQRFIDKKYSADIETPPPLPKDQGLATGYFAGVDEGNKVPLHKALPEDGGPAPEPLP